MAMQRELPHERLTDQSSQAEVVAVVQWMGHQQEEVIAALWGRVAGYDVDTGDPIREGGMLEQVEYLYKTAQGENGTIPARLRFEKRWQFLTVIAGGALTVLASLVAAVAALAG